MQDKAYKVLAKHKNLSNNQAKELIDGGFVFIADKKVKIARALVDIDTKFRILNYQEPRVIFEDENLLAIDKPYGIKSEDLEKKFKFKLLHRLDKETSGVLLFVKSEEFQKKAIEEFKNERVYKEYVAIVEGIVADEIEIESPILTKKGKFGAKSLISEDGKRAYSKVFPLEVVGKKSKVKVIIKTGRTHQIRVHLQSIGHTIVGDELYGSRKRATRLMLHSREIELLGYKFESKEPKEFNLS